MPEYIVKNSQNYIGKNYRHTKSTKLRFNFKRKIVISAYETLEGVYYFSMEMFIMELPYPRPPFPIVWIEFDLPQIFKCLFRGAGDGLEV